MQRGGKLTDYREQDKLLYWYIQTFLWGRYSTSTESALNQDLIALDTIDGALDRLIENLRTSRGDLHVSPSDFTGSSLGTGVRFYPMLYMLTRVSLVKDWGSGVVLSNHLLGHLSRLELHHIFPKALLYKHGYSRSEANALANFTFLTQETNLKISSRPPAEYLPEYVKNQPAAVQSHWIPMDSELWKVENYRDFLAARRELLASAANTFLDSLLQGSLPQVEVAPSIFEQPSPALPIIVGGVGSEDEERLLAECNEWVMSQELPSGEFRYELSDPVTGEALAVLDLAWPNGLQQGLSQPVAVLIDEGEEMEALVSQHGYRFYTDLNAFRTYVEKDILVLEPVMNFEQQVW